MTATTSTTTTSSSIAPEAKAAMWQAIQCMNDPSSPCLYDVTIICTTDDHQADFWESRLSQGVCSGRNNNNNNNNDDSPSLFPMVLAVSEDWANPSGAGNGLGTLYAFEKARRLAQQRHNLDIFHLLSSNEISAALYHTAGKGTRLAPLPASENNNKPGVKLPLSHVLQDGSTAPLTVLEAVVKQTGIYASSRLGRLSVFWGDQVFVPSSPFQYTPTHHVDILCTLLDHVPSAEEWTSQGLDKYGVIGVSSAQDQNAAQVEKVDRDTAVQMWNQLGDIGRVGPSLGSFSMSAHILQALLQEFAHELIHKEAKFDTDPHFWMPITLPKSDYVQLMTQKGVDEATSAPHHDRMTVLKNNFLESSTGNSSMGVFGAVDVGKSACWWDYGLLKLYSTNNLKLLLEEEHEEASLLRSFYGCTSKRMDSTVSELIQVDDRSCLYSSNLRGAGNVVNSILSNVIAVDVEADGAIIVNCTARKIRAGKGSILYNLVDDSEEGIVAQEGEVVVSVTEEDGSFYKVRSHLDICGGKAWKEVVLNNSTSFEEIHERNKNANVGKIEIVRKTLSRKTSDSFGV